MSELPKIRHCDSDGCPNWLPEDAAPVAERHVGIGYVPAFLCDDCTRRMRRTVVVSKLTHHDPEPQPEPKHEVVTKEEPQPQHQPRRRGRPSKSR